MTNYRDIARDLRTLADNLEARADDLPQPKYHNGVEIGFSFPERDDVVQAAQVFDVTPAEGAHTTADVVYGTARLHFVYISDAARVKYRASTSYCPNIQATHATATRSAS